MIIQGKFKILSNKKIGPEHFKMFIHAPRIVKQARPGQFVHLRCKGTTEPLLRRPFSFHRLNKNNFGILYKIVGRGTNLLAKKRKGDIVDVLGPLGNGFECERRAPAGRSLGVGGKNEERRTILVAGGMGVAPLFAWAEKLAHPKDIFVLIGARTKKAILCTEEFKKLGANVQIATDNGSKGYKGLVSALLKKILRRTPAGRSPGVGGKNEERRTIYACGPKPMLREIARISSRQQIPAYASFEENMACGVGACLGCAIKTKKGFKRVCKDGPVFELKEIKW